MKKTEAFEALDGSLHKTAEAAVRESLKFLGNTHEEKLNDFQINFLINKAKDIRDMFDVLVQQNAQFNVRSKSDPFDNAR